MEIDMTFMLNLKNSNRSNIEAIMASNNLKNIAKTELLRTTAAPVYRMPPVKDLEKRWGEFKNHFTLYTEIFEAYRYIGRLLTSKEFTSYISQFYNEKESSSNKELLTALNTKDNDYFYMAVGPKAVTTKISFSDLHITLDLSKDPQTLMDSETILKALFPTYKTPSKWEKKTIEDGNIKRETYSIGEDLTVTIPLKKFVSIKPRFTPTNDKIKANDLKFALSKRYFDGNFDNIASIKLTLKQSDTSPAGPYNYGDSYRNQTEGTLLQGSFKPRIDIEVEAILDWPNEFAYYVTCANGPTDFIPFLFFQYISWHKAVYSGGRTRGGGMGQRPSRINHLDNIIERNNKEKAAGRNPKIRTNEDEFLTLGVGESAETGEVYWIPNNVNRVGDYLNQIKAAYNGTENKIDLKGIKLKGEGLYTDPYNEVFTYLREEGVGLSSADISGIQTLDLTGSVALDNITNFKNMDKSLSLEDTGDFIWFLTIMMKFLNGDMKSTGVVLSKDYNFEDYLSKAGLNIKNVYGANDIKNYILDKIRKFGDKFNWANIGGQPLKLTPSNSDDIDETVKPEAFTDVRACFKFIVDVAGDMLNQLDKLNVGYIHKLSKLRYILYIITRYTNKYPQFKEEHDNAVKNNEIKPISDAVFKSALDNITMPNLTGLTKSLPHQLETYIEMNPPPFAALTEISAGGGKTAIELIEIANLLYKNLINRAIVVVPGNLVRNWVNEILYFSKGKINAFALNINTLRRMQYVYNKNPDPVQKPDYKMLKQIIESLPKNTIIVTSYRFLANDRERIVYGNKIIQRYYIAEFLRDLGFDLVACDESHYLKNLSSNTTTAGAILLSSAKYKRELSGTAVMDNLSDLVGQAGIMVPSALGANSRFTKNFSESGDWDLDAPEKITQEMRPYIKRIVHKRQKWAAMLPKLNEDFTTVNMTPKQYAFYLNLLESKIDEIKKTNPKLYAKLIDGNDKDSKAIESGLNTYFQAVEQFLYAPDSNEAFVQLEDLEPEDLISPKIAAVSKILDNHFNGYTDSQGREQAANSHKVIIFSHRTKTSIHVMKYLPEKYRKMAVRYEAGDFQALQQFLTNDKFQILIADEISINTGQNFQIASRMIRLETLWSPGAQEQAIARIWRPAFKIGSDRQTVFMNWIFTDNSLEVCKVGRLISKIITKTRYDQQDNRYFINEKFIPSQKFVQQWGNILPSIRQPLAVNDMLGSLPLIKMNTKTLLNFNSRQQLDEYFATYSLLNSWEDKEFDRLKAEKRYAAPLTIPASAYKEIPNSKSISYTPRVPGVDPSGFDPDDKMGYKPISIVEENNNTGAEEDEDGEEIETEINPVVNGTLVDTEFGFGHVTKIMQNDVWVDIVGIGEVKIPKTTAWVITNKKMEAEITRRLAQPGNNNPRLPLPITNLLKTPKSVKKPIEEEEEIDQEEQIKSKPAPQKREPIDEFDEDEETEEQLPIWSAIIDTQIALFTEYAPETEILVEKYGWKLVPAYTTIQIPNAIALEKVLNKLKTKYQVRSEYINNLEYYKTMLQNHSLDVAKPNMVRQTLRFFGVEEHKKLKPNALRPFPIIFDGHFQIAFDKANTPSLPQAVNDIRSLGISGLHIIKQAPVAIKFYTNKDLAIDDLKTLNKKIANPHYDDALKHLNNIKIKTPPSVTTPQTSTPKTSIIPRLSLTKEPTKIEVTKTVPQKKTVTPTTSIKPKVNTVISPVTKKPLFQLNLHGRGKLK